MCAIDIESLCRRALPPRSEAAAWSGHLATDTGNGAQTGGFKIITLHTMVLLKYFFLYITG